MTQDGQRILETVTGLSQKNYDDGPMDLFRQKTLYSLRVFFPTLEEDAFDTLYSRLFQDGSYAESGEEALPSRVFYQDGIACYGILQIGGVRRNPHHGGDPRPTGPSGLPPA